MKKLNKIITILLLLLSLILLGSKKVFANNTANLFQKAEYSESFKKWLELSDEEKNKTIMPRMYDINYTETPTKNPLYLAKILKSSLNSRFSLKDIIPSNVVIKNQQQTNSCWAFSSLSSLETNLALSNYKNRINLNKVYDFSERHMEYATSKQFANNVENKKGYNRTVGSGGTSYFSSSYLTNGTGAIPESELPFENNENIIDISEIQNKTVSSQVYDTIYFPDYQKETTENKIQIINKIKQHIQNYGSVQSTIHGNSSSSSEFSCYNNTTGAKFCNNSSMHSIDHGVSIIGWDDNYSVDNFPAEAKPTSNGAWIVRNSWGERLNETKLSDLKEQIFNTYKQECIAKGWNSAQEIPNSFIQQAGYTIDNDNVYIKYGDNGLIYISYEDVNVSTQLFGIEKASDTLNYDNIYQYDELFAMPSLSLDTQNLLLCNIFDKKTTGKEYLTQVALYAPQTYTCKVYVNPNGTSKAKKDMQLVELKAGESETFSSGYHTLEFSQPIELTANSFTVMIEIQSTKSSTSIALESKLTNISEWWDTAVTETDKCFVAVGTDIDNCEWYDLGKLSDINSSLINGDSSIKAFTTNEIIDDSLKNIEIVTPPNKTSYFEGENFDKTGMVIKANYNNSTIPSIILDSSNYNITNGTNLKVGQDSVTITYKDKSVSQKISVEKNTITSLTIKTPPTKTEYKEGQNFDKTGMVIEATYKDGTKKEITDYIITNGNNLKSTQTEIIISYEDKTVALSITVTPNLLIEINIAKSPNKTKYVVGQNFDKTGMIITGTYQDNSTFEIVDYTIENGTNLTKNQTFVTIKYENKTTTQEITVEEKNIDNISISKLPSKLSYIQNKENLDLTNGILKITYNDNSTENLPLTSEEVVVSGFSNSTLGKIILTVTYKNYTTKFEVEILEEEKAVNSNIVNAKSTIKRFQTYYYTDNSKQDYSLINVEIANISRNLNNDSIEYYYYLSSNKDEQNINNWVKITETQTSNNSLNFTIDTSKLSNSSQLADENVLYLYIKEVAIKGGNQSIVLSNALSLDFNVEMETYVDNVKKENMNSGITQDPTIATSTLPKAGMKTIIFIILSILLISGFCYIKYHKLKDIK